MTTPPASGTDGPDARSTPQAPSPGTSGSTSGGTSDNAPVDLGKGGAPRAEEPFDPYRFGRPDHPVPAEFAPPGYTPPTPAPEYSPMPQPPPYGAAPYGPPTGQYPPPYGPPPGQYPPPYGAPPPPQLHGYPQPRTGNGRAIASLVLGILSIVFFVFSIFDAVLIIPSLIFGILGLQESKRTGNGRGLAIAGLICMGVGVIAAVIWTVTIVHAANKCGGLTSDTSSTEFQQCVQDRIFGS